MAAARPVGQGAHVRVRGAHVLDVPILRPSARLRAHSGERQTTSCMRPHSQTDGKPPWSIYQKDSTFTLSYGSDDHSTKPVPTQFHLQLWSRACCHVCRVGSRIPTSAAPPPPRPPARAPPRPPHPPPPPPSHRTLVASPLVGACVSRARIRAPPSPPRPRSSQRPIQRPAPPRPIPTTPVPTPLPPCCR